MQTVVDSFRELALGRSDLCAALWQTSERREFLDRVQQIGADHGLLLSREEISRNLSAHRREWRERGPIYVQPVDLDGWMPIRVAWREREPVVEWCYMGSRRLREPFFEETALACLRHPLNMLVRLQTPMNRVLEESVRKPGVTPKGFIFHMSRCGSTLVAQALASLPQAIVLAEAEPIDAVVRARFHHPTLSDDEQAHWLQAMVHVLGRPRNPQEKDVFIKFDSWHIMDLPLIQRAFPDVPWLFLYRDPVEVMVSHQRMPGSQMIPGVIEPALLGFEPDMVVGMPLDEYCARTLGALCAAALRFRQRGTGMFVPYQHLPEAIWSSLPACFGLILSPADIQHMQHVAQFHAKSPANRFASDAAEKQQQATTRLRQLAEQWVYPAYQQLG